MSATALNAPRRSSPPDARVRVCVRCGSLSGNGFDASAKEQIRAAWGDRRWLASKAVAPLSL